MSGERPSDTPTAIEGATPSVDELDSVERSTDRSGDDFLRRVAGVEKIAPPTAEPDLTGKRLGRYQIRSKLGQGGMGIVYAAEDVQLRRTVALKLLPRSFADDERRQRFLREARAASAVTHPNIATVYDVGDVDGSVFIAMEHVSGTTLRALLEKQHGELPVAEAVRIAREIARGVAKAHAAGIVHRDLKPDNVMVGTDGQVKVLDFGLAKATLTSDGDEPVPPESPSEFATRDGRILGTPSYMSPEQARGRPVDARSDVFSLGVVLYELLTGRRPFAGGTTMELVIAIDRDPPPRAARLNREVSPALQRVLDRCLEKSPAARYANADELARALDALPADARRRNRLLLVFLVVLMALAATVMARRRAEPPLPSAESATPRLTAAAAPSVTATASSVAAAPAGTVTSAPVPSASASRTVPRARATSRPRVDPLGDQK